MSIGEDIYEIPRITGECETITKLNYRLKPTVELSILGRL